MYKSHKQSICNLTNKLKSDNSVLSLIIAGSIAHGFATESSDIDVMIVINEREYKKRLKSNKLHYFDKDSCTYDGYIDGKYIGLDFLRKVADIGSEPARYAFCDSKITFTKNDLIPKIIKKIIQYPIEEKKSKIKRFYAQVEAWKWYYYEALKYKNKYLLNLSIQKMILFGGRMLFAYNEVFYPYHKWFLKELYRIKRKPANLKEQIEMLLINPNSNTVEDFYQNIIAYLRFDKKEIDWPSQFMIDSELNWLNSDAPIDDI